MTGNPFDFTGLRSGPGCSRASAPASRSRPPTTAERLEARAAELQRDGARVFIAAVSAFAALASAFLYLHFGRKSELAAAREALDLAETRRQVIVDLSGRLESLERRHKSMKRDCERRTRELQTALDTTRTQAREEAYRTQHFYAAALSDLLNDLRGDLERIPPDVEAALIRVRKLLAGERPAA
jgi:hypothetical protein